MNTANLAHRPRQRAAEPPPNRPPENPRQCESPANGRDSELFMQLLDNADNVAWQAQTSQPLDTFASQSTTSAACPPEWGPLQQKLIELLPERHEQAGQAGQALQATLLMPNLGEIGLALKPMPGNGWNITLRFARRAALEKIRDSREHCRHSLADSLGRPIKLEFDDRERWA
nr:type III secretion system HrpP C-terminal domain-containing protein [uncultured Pseudomonas sp.]